MVEVELLLYQIKDIMKQTILLSLIILRFSVGLQAQAVTSLTTITANGGVSVEADGSLIVSHFGPLPVVPSEAGRDIFRISPDGEIDTLVQNVVFVGTGNAIDSEGFIYQGSFLENKVIKVDPEGTVVNDTFFSVGGPVGLTIIAEDTLVVCSCNTNTVFKVAQDGGVKAFASGEAFACANGITQDEQGNIYTTNFSDPRITRISPDGTTTTLGSTLAGNGHLAYRPANEKIYIASYSGNQIFQMDREGNVELLAGTGESGALDSENPLDATFAKPNGIAISLDGCSLYITQDENVIREIKFSDHGCTTAIEAVEVTNEYEISPNPASDYITFFNRTAVGAVQIEFIQASGKSVKRVQNPGSIIKVGDLSTGIYYLHILDQEGRRFVKRMVIL